MKSQSLYLKRIARTITLRAYTSDFQSFWKIYLQTNTNFHEPIIVQIPLLTRNSWEVEENVVDKDNALCALTD